MKRDDLDPARGCLLGTVLGLVFAFASGYIWAAIYDHASQPEVEPVCRDEFGHRCR